MDQSHKASGGHRSSKRQGSVDGRTLESQVRQAASTTVAATLCIEWIEQKIDTARFGPEGPSTGLAALRELSKGRKSVLFRVETPSGRLKTWLQAGADPVSASPISIERIGFERLQRGTSSVVRAKSGDPLFSAFEDQYPNAVSVVVAPIHKHGRLFGAIASVITDQEEVDTVATACTAQAALALNARFEEHSQNARLATVIHDEPRTTIEFEAFCNKLDLQLACAPSSGPGVSIVVFVYLQDRILHSRTSRGVLRIPQAVLDALLSTLRVDDIATRAESDAVAIALPQTGIEIAKKVAIRLQNAAKRVQLGNARCAYALIRADVRSKSAREVIHRALSHARDTIGQGMSQ